MYTDVFEVLDDVDLEDEKDSLILWLHNFQTLKEDIELLFGLDTSAKLKSHYRRGAISVGKRVLEIKQNSDDADFCKAIFKVSVGKQVGYADILTAIGRSGDLGKKDWK